MIGSLARGDAPDRQCPNQLPDYQIIQLPDEASDCPMKHLTIGDTQYRVICVERDGQWTARAERDATGDPFGIECSGASDAEAIARGAGSSLVPSRLAAASSRDILSPRST